MSTPKGSFLALVVAEYLNHVYRDQRSHSRGVTIMLQPDTMYSERIGRIIMRMLREAPTEDVIISLVPTGVQIHNPQSGALHIVEESWDKRLTA